MDSTAAIAEAIQAASRDLGLPVPPRERASHVIGLGLKDSLSIAVPELPESRYREFAAAYRRHFVAREPTMTLFPGVRELLGRLRAQGYALAVATGKSRQGLDRALAASALGECFAATRCADETHPKPHPAMLNELMAELSFVPRQLLMIGDTSHDVEMAHSARVDAVAVAYGAHPEDSLRAQRPRGVVRSVVELDAWLGEHA